MFLILLLLGLIFLLAGAFTVKWLLIVGLALLLFSALSRQSY